MLDLSRITLFCVETRAPHLALFAIVKCTRFAKFGKVILATNPDLQFFLPDHITRIATPPITSTEAYSEYLLSDLTKHFLGTHVLVIDQISASAIKVLPSKPNVIVVELDVRHKNALPLTTCVDSEN